MTSHGSSNGDGIADADLDAIEALALELARLAGAEIELALGSGFTVRYKGGNEDTLRDPVSEIDHNVEVLIRSRLGERFPDHDIIGEELDERPGRSDDVVWAIDPIDGTTNFVNGFPVFAASIGILVRGRPVAGAIWSSITHALRPGVYHGRAGGRLRFDNQAVTLAPNPSVRRRLAGAPVIPREKSVWDLRKTGSAAVECALVAMGILDVARFESPNIWDVAGGAALIAVAGGSVMEQVGDSWRELETFAGGANEAGPGDLRSWRRPMIVGAPDSVSAMIGRG